MHFSMKSLSSVVTALLMGSTPLEQALLMIPFELGKKEKSHKERDQVKMEVVPVQQYSSQPGTGRCSIYCQPKHCCLKAVTIYPAITLVSSHGIFLLALLIARLVLWQELTVDDVLHIDECAQHDFDFWIWMSCFFRPRWLLLTAWALGFPIILKIPCLIASDDPTKQVWSSLKTLDDVLIHLYETLFQITIQQS